jgi:hypothetical protein
VVATQMVNKSTGPDLRANKMLIDEQQAVHTT